MKNKTLEKHAIELWSPIKQEYAPTLLPVFDTPLEAGNFARAHLKLPENLNGHKKNGQGRFRVMPKTVTIQPEKSEAQKIVDQYRKVNPNEQTETREKLNATAKALRDSLKIVPTAKPNKKAKARKTSKARPKTRKPAAKKAKAKKTTPKRKAGKRKK